MPSRKQAFLETVQELQEEFLVQFPKGPTASTQSIIDRIRRSLSWLHRAASISDEDRPPRFVDLWIALNALYSQPRYAREAREKEDFSEFIQRLTSLRSGQYSLGQLISKKYLQERTQELIQNKYLWNEWWKQDIESYRGKRDERSVRFEKALRNGDTVILLNCLFERLQVLRNQIIHGSSSASTRKNRDALYPAILLLEEIVPEFIRLMTREGQGIDWPPIPYPGNGTPQHPEQL